MNKSTHIRRYMAHNPEAGPKQIRQGLADEGIHVSAALVNRIKYGAGAGGKKKRRGRKPKAAAAASGNGAGSLSLENLLAAKKLVVQLGSVESAKQAVDALARLS
ncbi:MAG TPA: hypothetical protein PK867_20915 [Pirellulales bacterium]|nr:hypothetical protein [Pirellulales bacterium]